MTRQNAPTFRWKLSYMGGVEYEVFDETGHYRVEIRQHSPDAYELSIANGDDVRSAWKSAVGILRRASGFSKRVDGHHSFEVPPDVVDAFNEWRMEQHLAMIANMESQPERYGVIAPDDELRKPPHLARGGDYNYEDHRWEVTHALA
ncbi:hypothetical protein ACRQ5Q_14695 [Bradyrhizobium sp. PMVTL-01]|uniref:hypothetical protein n=1 Tax=Bradyrhizobium sp. PMVTL-01 TaxID=3434999 RepID=UPI003F6E8044